MLRPCGSMLPTALLRSGAILQNLALAFFQPPQRMGFGTKRRREFLPRRPQTKEAMARQKKMKRPPVKNAEFTALRQLLLHNLKDASYGRYRQLESTAWRHSTHQFTLYVGTTQADPYAPPTRCRLVIPAHMAQFPAALLSSRTRRMAVADYLWRLAHQYCQEKGNVIAQAMAIEAAHERGRSLVKSWSGRKGGEVQIMAPTQYVMEQSAVQIDADGNVTCQVTVNLPAKGRTILGSQAYVVLDTVLGYLVQRCLIAPSLRIEELQAHMDSIEDQAWLQAQLERVGLVAFVRDGAILPRRSGHSDRPLPSDIAVPFQAPEQLQVSFTLPRSGRTITGLGIRNGITLICGGGYHGKSTLLEALQTGVYLKVPGDGRDFCVTSPQAMKIRAEDGRWVAAVDISSFVKNVPLNKDTTCFSTADASGSTSQASNIVEAIELGANTLLIDEDTCATNFMIRDAKMMQLVSCEKEPITPFVRVVTSLKEQGISTILVVGGTGDFFSVADHVLVMDHYRCEDATDRAKRIVQRSRDTFPAPQAPFGPILPRRIRSSVLAANGKIRVLARNILSYGNTEIDLSMTEQIVSSFQAKAIAKALQCLSESPDVDTSMRARLDALEERLDQAPLDEVLAPGKFHGAMMRPRKLEVGAALNRLRRHNCIEPMKKRVEEEEVAYRTESIDPSNTQGTR